MTSKALSGIIGSVLGLVACCAASGVLLLGGGAAATCTAPMPSGAPATSAPPGGWAPVGRFNTEQVGYAATITAVGAQMGVPIRGWIIAVATAIQESDLHNLPGGDRDSIGLFQQRPSQGWGTPQQLHDPVHAAGKFYQKLLTIQGWEQMTLTDAAQAVQVSAYPDAYAKHEPDATLLINTVVSANSRAIPEDLEQCVSIAGWTAPVRAPITSGFRTAERPDHDGVDLGAASETPVRAAAAGEVVTAWCDTDPSGRLCSHPGSPSTPGCGWYVKIRHVGDVVTMYCHLVRAPFVRVGQVLAAGQEIGRVGSTGHSSGPHLHFEARVGGAVVDPVVFMREHGVELGS